jgi:hypothetical protein
MKATVRSTITVFPVASLLVRKQLALEDYCPDCGGQLDTGWECNSCQFDARPLVARQYGLASRNGGGVDNG